jgi:hypothetical protein
MSRDIATATDSTRTTGQVFRSVELGREEDTA